MEASRSVQCASNQRQWGIAVHLYMADNDNYLPFDIHLVGTSAAGDTSPGIWFNELPLYVGAPRYAQIYTGSAGTKQYPNAHIWWCLSDRARFGPGGTTASGNAFDYSMNEVLDGTKTRGPNHGAGATAAHMQHVNARAIPDPALTLFMSERNTRVETRSIGTVDLDRHTDEFGNIVFMDAHVDRFHGRKVN